MKKTVTRLATIGGIVFLVATVIALAQHDARKREREQPERETLASQPAIPIPMEDPEGEWSAARSPATKLVVRANNDQMTRDGEGSLTEGANPLLATGGDAMPPSEVVHAAAGIPIEPPAKELPSTNRPPSWLGGNVGYGEPVAGGELSDSPAIESSLSNPPAAPMLPTFPLESDHSSLGYGAPPTGRPLPSQTTQLPSPPPTISSNVGDMSDTQRGALQPTDVLASPFTQPSPSYAPIHSSDEGDSTTLPQAVDSQANGSRIEGASAIRPEVVSPTRTPAALAGLVSNQPGDRYLEGSQNPNLLVQKRAPEEIQVGKRATFVITIRNAGNATAHNVRVMDSVPRGARFHDSAPAASPDAQGILLWELGEMAAGDERTIALQLIPEVQGEMGSNALVSFAVQASVRTVATLPKLELQLNSQPDMLIGSRQQIAVIVKNTGTGVARGARLEADLPELLRHDSGGAKLDAALGDMRPNEIRSITLDVTAVEPGHSMLAVRAASEDGASAEENLAIAVLAPQLAASIEGPKLRYLDRQATYRATVTNVGTTSATNLEFVVRLPSGLNYTSANNHGTYDPAQRTVSWRLEELPAGEPATVELTVLPVELGPQAITFAVTGDLGLKAEASGQVMVDGLAELEFVISQDNGTIEVGANSTYSVLITNVGNKPDKDVRLAVQLPSGSELMDARAQVGYRAEGDQIIFDPVPEMQNKDQYAFHFQVQHNRAGTQIVRAQLTSENWPVAVFKDEGTLVYNDQN